MEIINNLKALLAQESKDVKELNDSFIELNSRMMEESGHIDRLDRIARIEALKARLISE